ncbi:endonuclease domain-containing protein [Humibacillus xanthopallidus]|uniref:endonuclease domain-containing protein n=1 Tax=Humibacillus xanthopallidus TaxID=412689 RepID=UPI003851074D
MPCRWLSRTAYRSVGWDDGRPFGGLDQAAEHDPRHLPPRTVVTRPFRLWRSPAGALPAPPPSSHDHPAPAPARTHDSRRRHHRDAARRHLLVARAAAGRAVAAHRTGARRGPRAAHRPRQLRSARCGRGAGSRSADDRCRIAPHRGTALGVEGQDRAPSARRHAPGPTQAAREHPRLRDGAPPHPRPGRHRGRLGHHPGAHRPRLLPRPALRRGPLRRRLGAARRAAQKRPRHGGQGARPAPPGSRAGRRQAGQRTSGQPLRVGAAGHRPGRHREDPQHRIRYDDFYARVDLADERLRLVLEADSFEFHGERAAMSRDAERYDELVSRGWLVLRFTWEQVMLRPAWVARVIERTVRRRIAELGADEGRLTTSRPSAAAA